MKRETLRVLAHRIDILAGAVHQSETDYREAHRAETEKAVEAWDKERYKALLAAVAAQPAKFVVKGGWRDYGLQSEKWCEAYDKKHPKPETDSMQLRTVEFPALNTTVHVPDKYKASFVALADKIDAAFLADDGAQLAEIITKAGQDILKLARTKK